MSPICSDIVLGKSKHRNTKRPQCSGENNMNGWTRNSRSLKNNQSDKVALTTGKVGMGSGQKKQHSSSHTYK